MKRIYEMNEAELLSLDDEQTVKLVDYECALEGVPMLPPSPGPEPKKVTAAPDVTLYQIAGQNTLDHDHAKRILDACNSAPLFETSNPRNDYQTVYLTPLTEKSYNRPKIETSSAHSPEQWDKIKNDFTSFSERKDEWDAINKVYQAAVKERQQITDDVYSKISDARRHAYEREQLRLEFNRYLELAEGSKSIALKFLLKVKSLNDFPELMEEFEPGPEVMEVQSES